MITPESAKFLVDCIRVMAMFCGIFSIKRQFDPNLPENPIPWMGLLARLGLAKLINDSRSTLLSRGAVMSRMALAFRENTTPPSSRPLTQRSSPDDSFALKLPGPKP